MRSPLPPLWLAVALLGCASREPEPARGKEPAVEPSAAPPAEPAAAAPGAPSAPAPPAGPGEARVWAKTRFVWVHPEPGSEGWIGFLWFGGSVKLKEPEPKSGPGCSKWYAIEPRGWVCVDGVRATLDERDPALVALRPYAPNVSTPWPHKYGESRGVNRYAEIPKRTEQRQREWDLEEHTDRVAAARRGEKVHESLVGVNLSPATSPAFSLGKLPSTVHEPRKRLLPLSTVAYSAEAAGEDRTWLLSADLLWVPKD